MFILAGGEPSPLKDETQINPDLVEGKIRLAQVPQPDFVLVHLGFQERFLKIQGGIPGWGL